jgi:hypothetical protein
MTNTENIMWCSYLMQVWVTLVPTTEKMQTYPLSDNLKTDTPVPERVPSGVITGVVEADDELFCE